MASKNTLPDSLTPESPLPLQRAFSGREAHPFQSFTSEESGDVGGGIGKQAEQGEMADEGAWQSGVFDNGRDFQRGADHHDKATASAGGGLSPVPGVPAAMYNPPTSIAGGKDGAHLPLISIALRIACIVFTLIGFAVIASNQGSDSSYYVSETWKAVNSSNMA